MKGDRESVTAQAKVDYILRFINSGGQDVNPPRRVIETIEFTVQQQKGAFYIENAQGTIFELLK